jgi:hypothetical protein
VPRGTAAAPAADLAALTALGNRQVAELAGAATSVAAARALVRAAAAGGNRAAARAAVMRQDRPRVYGPPTEEQAAEAVLVGAARLLSIPNFISGRIDHTNAVEGMTVAARERYALFELWLAATARETREGPVAGESSYRRATTAERLAGLERADHVLQQLARHLGPAPVQGTAGEALRSYQAAYRGARERILDDHVEAALEAQPTPIVHEGPEFELERQRRTVEDALGALDLYGGLAARTAASTASRFGTEIRQALQQVAARAPEGSRLAGVANMPLPEAILHTRGVLNGINAILQVTDERRRAELFTAQWNVRDAAETSRVVLGLVEGLAATVALIGSAVARLRGNAVLASKLFGLGANTFVRRIGWIASLAQTVHGLAVLLDDRSTENERLQAVFDVAMGSAGLTGAVATLGVEALAGIAGPLTAGIVITAAEVTWLRSQNRGFEQGMATAGIRESFDLVEYEAGGVAFAANELAEAMRYAEGAARGPQPVGDPGELAAAAQRAVQLKTTGLREFLERAIERVTRRQSSLAILFQPASWEHVRAPFEALRPRLAARTPSDLAGVAAAYVAAARDLFRHFERTISRTLVGVDRSREGGVLPHILGGLHSGLQERAAMGQGAQMPVP